MSKSIHLTSVSSCLIKRITQSAYFFFLLLLLTGFAMNGVGQGNFTSKGSANWNSGTGAGAAWTLSSGSDADGVPDSDDAVSINAGHTITVTANAGCSSLTFLGSGTQTLSINSGITLTVTGNVAQNSGAVTKTANIQGLGALVCGSVNVGNALLSASGTHTQTINSSISLLDCSGGLTIYSTQEGVNSDKWNTTFNASAGKVKFSSIAMTAESNGSNLSSATFSVTDVLELTGGPNPWSFAGAGSLTATIGASSTVIYSGSVNQNVYARSYNNLQLTGSGTKTITSGSTISSNLSISGSAVASLNAGTTYTIGSLTLGGYGKINGTWGSTTATTATYQTNTFFAATTGRLSVTNDTRPALTVTASAQSKDYGATAPTSGTLNTNYTVIGTYVGSDAANTLALGYSGSPVAGNESTAPVGSYTITPSAFTVTGGAVVPSSAASNYNITYTTGTLTVNKKALTITADNQTVTAGTSVATVTGNGSYTPTGFENSETSSVITGSVTYTTNYTTSTAAGASGITLTPDVTGLSATNYSFTPANGTITVTSGVVTSVTWGGTAGGSWSTPGNWNEGVLPTSSMDVNITAGYPVMDVDFTIGSGKTLTISGTGSLVIAAGKILTVTGSANFGSKSVTLKSSSAGTAAIGTITGSLTGATNVTVERYIPAQRKWRMLTAPLTGNSSNTIYANWQNGGTADGSTGAIFWSNTGGTGLYTGGLSTSILSFNSTLSTQGGWEAVSNTQAAASLFSNTANKSYIAFITGPYNTTGNYINGSAVATTLKATGTLRSGAVSFSGLTNGKYHIVGNPYASAVSFNTIGRTNAGSFVYVWDPVLGSLGGYTPISNAAGEILESGQAFLVLAQGGDATISFAESDKNSNTANTMFRRQNTDPKFTVKLNKFISGVPKLYDRIWVDYQAEANAGVDGDDAVKPSNFTENLSIVRNAIDLMVERRPYIVTNDTIQLRMWKTTASQYQFEIVPERMTIPAGVSAVLQDLYLGTETVLSLTDAQTVNFSVNQDAGSTGNRFRIVFRTSVITPVTNINGEKAFAIYPNPVSKGGMMQLSFSNRAAGVYSVRIFNLAGAQVQQENVRHAGGTGVQQLRLNTQLAPGTYVAEISGLDGVNEKVKMVVE